MGPIGQLALSILILPILLTGCQFSLTEESARLRFREAIDLNAFEWLREATRKEIQGCIIPAHDGTSLYTPDGVGNYHALWTRDFCFMVEYAGDLLDPNEIQRAVRYLLAGQREDGCMPDRVRADGVPVYSPGGDTNPINDHAKDNGPFMAKLVALDVNRRGDLDFFREVEPALRRGLDFLERSPDGLVWNDPDNPQSPFGFTDTVAKTGDLLFSSLLYWEACKSLEDLSTQSGAGDTDEYALRARAIEQGLQTLWDEESGMFFAASRDCRQIDLWGSAYAVYIGIATPEQIERIAQYLDANISRMVQHGQVCHLPDGASWDRMLVPVKPGTYQNGAYWGTGSGWIIYALHKRSPERAGKMFNDLVAYYRRYGIYECVNGEDRKLPHYVASATNPYGIVRDLLDKAGASRP